jgi:cell division ATPase FtsA
LDDSELDAETKSHIVLTGGASSLPGLADLMRRTIATKVRIGTPIMDGIPSELLNPSHATGVGILIRVLKNAFKGNKPNNKIGYNPKGKLKTGMLSRIG